jgi:drug/metabolite transporter (DMT)-like permease
VLWLWLRHGERPGAITLTGAGLAALGLVLVLDLASGADLDLTGVLWALGAMVGLATYFLISADDANGLPPLALAAGGLLVGTVALGGLALSGLLPMRATSEPPTYAGQAVAAWVPLLGLGLVSAALAFTTGIAASRRLGSRLASFVGLTEVVAGVGAAWLLLGELPGLVQLGGGVLILVGVVAVKIGEKDVAERSGSR